MPEVVDQYQEYDKRTLRKKRTPMQSSVILTPEDSPAIPDTSKQQWYRSVIVKLQFAATMTWVRYDISYSVASGGLPASVHRQVRRTGQRCGT